MARKQKSGNKTGCLVLLLLSFVVGSAAICGLSFFAISAIEGPSTIEKNSWLYVRLNGSVGEQTQAGPFQPPEQRGANITQIAQEIRRAGDDWRIDGLYLRLDNFSAGMGGHETIRAALEEFRLKNKPCVVYAEMLTSPSYYLASACNKIVVSPGGLVMPNGISVHATFFADLFERFGIKADFVHVGDYKSAAEQYTRNAPSLPAQEAMNALLDDIYTQMLEGIAKGREVEVEKVKAWIDDPAMSPDEALKRGMVDALAYPDQAIVFAREYHKEDWQQTLTEIPTIKSEEELDERFAHIDDYFHEPREDEAKKKIAVIVADGMIQPGSVDSGFFGKEALTDRSFRSWIEEAREDEDVAAIVIRVNSPGGSGAASDIMWHEITKTQHRDKPVVISMGDYAASGGYYIAAPADAIVAEPTTITGSIGVFGGKFVFSGTAEQYGVGLHNYQRGEQANLFSALDTFSDAQRTSFSRYLQSFYGQFISKVAMGRSMEQAKVEEVAQGRVWTGKQAKEHGLVDELGSIGRAIELAAEKAGVDNYRTQYFPSPVDPFTAFLEQLDRGPTLAAPKIEAPLPKDVAGQFNALQTMQVLTEDGAIALMPFAIED